MLEVTKPGFFLAHRLGRKNDGAERVWTTCTGKGNLSTGSPMTKEVVVHQKEGRLHFVSRNFHCALEISHRMLPKLTLSIRIWFTKTSDLQFHKSSILLLIGNSQSVSSSGIMTAVILGIIGLSRMQGPCQAAHLQRRSSLSLRRLSCGNGYYILTPYLTHYELSLMN